MTFICRHRRVPANGKVRFSKKFRAVTNFFLHSILYFTLRILRFILGCARYEVEMFLFSRVRMLSASIICSGLRCFFKPFIEFRRVFRIKTLFACRDFVSEFGVILD